MDLNIKKKRGRRKKNTDDQPQTEPINIQYMIEENIIEPNVEQPIEEQTVNQMSTSKKRGRKPKGGKLILKQPYLDNKPKPITNIILHLKCSLNDLNVYNEDFNKYVTNPLSYNPTIPPDIKTYNNGINDNYSVYDNINNQPTNCDVQFINNQNASNNQNNNNNNFFAYSDLNPSNNKGDVAFGASAFSPPYTIDNNICKNCNNKLIETEQQVIIEDDDNILIKDVNSKLKKLKINLYKNNLADKKSACFWCTYEFDNPECYIPKYEMDETIFGYGSFCRPECAVAFLMKENIDDSTKFERYHLLNQIYSKVYNYKKNIKPAPNPHFLLDKFYGNLSIQEYRKLLKTEHLLLVIDKPLTRILPELHEDNEDFILNIYGGNNNKITSNTNQSGIYKVKRQSEKQQGPTKTSIMRDQFGL